MSLTIFLALAILGCDVLIYFLYEWAFGESKRIRKRRASSHLWADTAVGREGHISRSEGNRPSSAPVIGMDRKRAKPSAAPARPNAYEERLAYRRMAASFAQLKPRT